MTQKDSEDNGTVTRRQLQQQRLRPLYDIPYMWEAREFLRKKLIGKKVINGFPGLGGSNKQTKPE